MATYRFLAGAGIAVFFAQFALAFYQGLWLPYQPTPERPFELVNVKGPHRYGTATERRLNDLQEPIMIGSFALALVAGGLGERLKEKLYPPPLRPPFRMR